MKTAFLALGVSLALAGVVADAGAAPPSSPRPAGHYAAKTERGRLAGHIVRQWSGYVTRIYGTAPADWARSMQATFAQARIANLRRAASMQTYEAMSAALLGHNVTDAEAIDQLARTDGSPMQIAQLGSVSSDLVYTPLVTPCRIADTRVISDPIEANTRRVFLGNTSTTFTGQGGAAQNCGIPAEPSALVLNVKAIGLPDGGFMTLYQAGTSIRPAVSSISGRTGAAIANELIVRQAINVAEGDFAVFSSHTADVAIDVMGYFMAPRATALECIGRSSRAMEVPDTGLPVQVPFDGCDAGMTATGMLCYGIGDSTQLGLESIKEGSCVYHDAKPGDGKAGQAFAAATCCWLPGR